VLPQEFKEWNEEAMQSTNPLLAFLQKGKLKACNGYAEKIKGQGELFTIADDTMRPGK
jgi:hypothetical protein